MSDVPLSLSLSLRLRDETRALHRLAERSGAMGELLQGRLDPAAYGALLRNLHALYAALEPALDRHRQSPAVSAVRRPALYRASALRVDLVHWCGTGWAAAPLTAAMSAYLDRLREIDGGQHALLAAHAYVRYLGDLSGGQLLRHIVQRTYGLHGAVGTAFYRFEAVDVALVKTQFRAALDELPADDALAAQIVAEACAAFRRHATLFQELA